MTEWTTLIPIIAVLVQGSIAIFIAFITWYNQKRTARDVEELRHKLTKKRVSMEKWVEKAEPIYLDIIKTCSNINTYMGKIAGMLLNRGKDLYPLAMLYVYSSISKNIEKTIFFHKATENEKFQIEKLDKFLHLNSLTHSLDELQNMEGYVELYALSETKKLYTILRSLTLYFQFCLANRIDFLIKESTKRTSSPAECLALEIFSGDLELMNHPQILEIQEELDFETSVNGFGGIFKKIINQMKNDLKEGPNSE